MILIAALGGCDERSNYPEYKLVGEISSKSIPMSAEDAVLRLDEVLPAEAKEWLIGCDPHPANQACREFNVKFRLRLERHVSNDWIRPSESRLRNSMTEDGYTDPEDMASAIISMYIEHLE